MRRRAHIGALACTALMAAGLPLLGTGIASAGTNGQQVAVSTWYSDEVYVCGDNQNGDYTCSNWFATPGTGYTELPNSWWKGEIFITGYDETNGQYYYATFTVPVSMSGNVYDCNGRTGKIL
jgi:hypothetical protein